MCRTAHLNLIRRQKRNEKEHDGSNCRYSRRSYVRNACSGGDHRERTHRYLPAYTITRPETVTLSATEHTQVPITASDVKYIPDGKKISVTFLKGNGTYGRLYMTGTYEETGKNYLMTLQIKGTSGEFKSGALEKQIKGMELASFTADGTMNYEVYPCSQDYPQYEGKDSNLAIQKGVQYSAYIDYGIALVDQQ